MGDSGDGVAGLMKRAPLLSDLQHAGLPNRALWVCDTKTTSAAEVKAGAARNAK
jgi:hypothetical protein